MNVSRVDAKCGQQSEGQRQVLGLRHLQGAFYVLLVGGGVAFLAFTAERVSGAQRGTAE